MSQDTFCISDVSVQALTDECIITKKVYGRCKQQDCLKPVDCDSPHHPHNYIKIDSSLFGGRIGGNITSTLSNPGSGLQPLVDSPISPGQIITLDSTVVKRVELDPKTQFTTDIKVTRVAPPGPFSLPGFYDVTIQYTFNYNLILFDAYGHEITVLITAINNGTPGTPVPVTTIPAYTTYCKRITLDGGVVDANVVVSIADTGIAPHHTFVNDGNVPYVYVQAISNPLLTKIGKYNTAACGTTPVYEYHADVVIGLFTIISLYRIVNMLVSSNGQCEPPQCEPSIITDPCDGFNKLLFPYDDFDPPFNP
jgi:hypothetical protein